MLKTQIKRLKQIVCLRNFKSIIFIDNLISKKNIQFECSFY